MTIALMSLVIGTVAVVTLAAVVAEYRLTNG
jgi:hypothetical protein